MSNVLRGGVITFTILMILGILYIVKKDRISVKYSLVWIITGIIMLIFALIPNFIENVAKLLGFELASNMIFVLMIGLLMLVSVSLTAIVSKQKKMITSLIQEVSLLKSKIEESTK